MRKYILSIIALVACCFLQHCTKHNDAPTTVLSVDVNPNYIAPGLQYWIMVHDINGHLIDYHSVKGGDQFDLQSKIGPVGGRVYVTTLNADPHTNYFCKTYLADVGKTIHLQMITYPFSVSPEVADGTFTVNIENSGPLSQIDISDSTGLTAFEEDLAAVTPYADSEFRPHTKRYMVSTVDVDGGKRYIMIDHVQRDQTITVDYNEMIKLFDVIPAVHVSIPSIPLFTLEAYSYSAGQTVDGYSGYRLTTVDQSMTQAGSIGLGFPNAFPQFSIAFFGSRGKVNYFYRKLSKPQVDIAIPDLTHPYIIEDTTFANFRMATPTMTFNYRITDWSYSVSNQMFMSWSVTSSLPDQPVFELPTEITTAYPDMHPDKLHHSFTQFILQTKPYSQYIEDIFSNGLDDKGDESTVAIDFSY